jgi:type IV secretory pathway VirB2 component (pilin)
VSRIVTLNWNNFNNVKFKPKSESIFTTYLKSGTNGAFVAFIPQSTLAATKSTENTWEEIFQTILNISDYLCMGVIVFAGATWMFGNRTKALELLIGGSIGYLIIRHSHDIMLWLKGL